MLSVHETVLSDTESSCNSNKQAVDDSNNTLKQINNRHSDDHLFKSAFYDSETGENDTLLLTQSSAKLHDFWPPGIVIQTPASNLQASNVSDKDIVVDNEAIKNNITSDIEQTKSLNTNFSHSSDLKSLNHENIPDGNEFVEANQNNDSQSTSTSLKNNGLNPYSNLDESNKYNLKNSKDIEYDAILEPDVELPEETGSDLMYDDSKTKSESEGMIIEDVTPSADSSASPDSLIFRPISIVYSDLSLTNRYPSLDAERNLFPIEETEKDDCDSDFQNTIYEAKDSQKNVPIKSYDISASLDFETQSKFQNGCKQEKSVEVSDLGYFSLDKESNLSNNSLTPEKLQQAESNLISSTVHSKNKINEKNLVDCVSALQDSIDGPFYCDDTLYGKEKDFKFSNVKVDLQSSASREAFSALNKDVFPDLLLKEDKPYMKDGYEVIEKEDNSFIQGTFVI